jgi:hypothetical protein
MKVSIFLSVINGMHSRSTRLRSFFRCQECFWHLDRSDTEFSSRQLQNKQETTHMFTFDLNAIIKARMKRENSIIISAVPRVIYRNSAYCQFLMEVWNKMCATFELNYLRSSRNILCATMIGGLRGRKEQDQFPRCHRNLWLSVLKQI